MHSSIRGKKDKEERLDKGDIFLKLRTKGKTYYASRQNAFCLDLADLLETLFRNQA